MVRLTLASAGWTEVMQPSLAERGRSAVKALVMSRTERAAKYKGTHFDADDDVLRAIVRDCEWMISVWIREVSATEHNRQLDELERQNSDAHATNSR